MTMVIQSNADVARILDHIRRAARKAEAHGNVVAGEAHKYLVPALADIEAAEVKWRPAVEAEAAARDAVTALDGQCHVIVASIRDDLWSLVGRTRHNRHMAQVFPGGVDTYTAGDPSRRPMLIGVLQGQIEACKAPLLTDEQRKAWIAALETARQGLADALAKHAPLDVAARIAEAAYRTAIRLGHEQLRLFKQALENLGLTKAQIFDIIPDATPQVPKTPKAPAETTTPKAA